MSSVISQPFQPATAAEWHTLDRQAVLVALGACDKGLPQAEALRRLQACGANVLPLQRQVPAWQILLRQCLSPIFYILGFAAIVSGVLGNVTDAAFIVIVLGMNVAIGGYQEWRAERSMRALQRLLTLHAAVERDGEVCEVNAESLVPGDIVWLESGVRVPADLRLLSAHGLEVDESLLTGESLPVDKDPDWIGATSAPIAERVNMAYAGSIVVRGRGKGAVVATGTATNVGQLALDLLRDTEGKPPLLLRMERFNRAVTVLVVLAAVIIALIGILGHGYPVSQMFFFAIALAVASIPEGLPVALTIALAIAAHRMAQRGVIVRRLAAVEGLGSCTLIASDKTGTLTCNELTVRQIHLPSGQVLEVSGEGYSPTGHVLFQGRPVDQSEHEALHALARAAVLCNEADLHPQDGGWTWRGDPTDIALLSLAHKLGWNREAALDLHPQVNEIPFEPEHRFAATYHAIDGTVRVFVKGAPERVLAMCAAQSDKESLRTWHEIAEKMAEQSYRVLALAEGAAPDALDRSAVPPAPSGLTFLGVVGILDPLRPGVVDAIAACHSAGITVCMITGDHPVTALAIARNLGMATRLDQVVTGRELEGKSSEQLQAVIQRARVFARVAPHQKLQLVEAARQAGHFVAVTGDGVNDAPALRAANIGVAVGKAGTDVAREAAELVISDDNFATIVAGIEEGRVAYDNVRKVIYLLVSGGVAEVVALGLAVAAGLPLPLLPVQLLWLNLVTNGIQGAALAFEPSEGDALQHPPRPPGEPIFNRLMIERTLIAAVVMGGVGFGVFWWLLQAGCGEVAARNALLLLFVLFLNVHIGNSRSETKSAFRLSPLRVPLLLGGAVATLLLHLVVLYLPLGHEVLHTEPVGWGMWLTLLGLSLTVFVAIEVHKWTWALRKRNRSLIEDRAQP